MRKIISAVLIATLLLTGCGAPMTLAGREYPTYGLFNQSTEKSDKVCYEISVGNVVWSILLVEGIVFPIYFVGFSIYNPIGLKDAAGKCGIDSGK